MDKKNKSLVQMHLKISQRIVYCEHDLNVPCIDCLDKIVGDMSGIRGNITEIYGDVSDISGDVSNITGDVSGILGDVTLLRGNVSGISADVGEILDLLSGKLI